MFIKEYLKSIIILDDIDEKNGLFFINRNGVDRRMLTVICPVLSCGASTTNARKNAVIPNDDHICIINNYLGLENFAKEYTTNQKMTTKLRSTEMFKRRCRLINDHYQWYACYDKITVEFKRGHVLINLDPDNPILDNWYGDKVPDLFNKGVLYRNFTEKVKLATATLRFATIFKFTHDNQKRIVIEYHNKKLERNYLILDEGKKPFIVLEPNIDITSYTLDEK